MADCPVARTEGNVGEFFRAGVGIVLRRRSTGEVLTFERIGLPGAWQYPQGGIEAGEDPREAVWRELREEIGLSTADVELVSEHARWTTYELPPEARSTKTGRGQTQRWFLFDVDADNPPLALAAHSSPEFRSWRWVMPAVAAATAVGFRQATYREVATWLGDEADGRA